MPMMDPEQVEAILKHHVAIMASAKEIRIEDRTAFEHICEQVKKLAEELDNRTVKVMQNQITQIIDFRVFGETLDVVADAPWFQIQTLLRIKDFFNQAFIKAPHRISLLLKLMWEYYNYWWNCWWSHRNLDRATLRKLQEASYAYASAASDIVGNFVSSTVEPLEKQLSREDEETKRKAEEEKEKVEKEIKGNTGWKNKLLGH